MLAGDHPPTSGDRESLLRDPFSGAETASICNSGQLVDPAAEVRVSSPLPKEFTTSEVIARRVQSTDLADLRRIDSDPNVMETLGGVRDRDATAADLKYDLEHWERHGFGLYLVKSARGEVVGRVGLRCRTFLGRREVEVAFSLRPMWWGRGLGTALARRLAELARDSHLSESLVATVEPANLASIRVLEKLGFTADGQLQRAGTTMTLYRLPLEP